MTVQLNHTIVFSHDKSASATFLADMLGLDQPSSYGPFMVVEVGHGTSLDFMDTGDAIPWQHYAFLVGEDEFDEIFGRIRDRALPYWADPHHSEPGKINHHDGGRGVYFEDPDGHNLEIITRPYGSGA
jgi:catechol 2,3-dioxygenase-like lactoylglutathione lyase family enzyme